ncbi:MAG TPA: hypothetical protein VFH44_12515 [Solirubrobacterales bacterium]|nr:hypothetical protein [Solirubrobacterales bacterium]
MNTRASAKLRTAYASLAAAAAAAAIAGCGGDEATDAEPDLPQGDEPVDLDPADFTTDIDNRWLPMSPGSRWVYRETDASGAEQRIVVRVTPRTRTIANGIEARVIRDVATEGGEPIEITDDWYAQDAAGNVWYLGERTAEFEHGELISRAGSWEAGVDGAEAGIAMPADPQSGMAYRQEHYAGEAEDHGAVISRGEERAGVPFGHFDEEVVMTRDLTPLEPRVEELKLYAPGIGNVLAVHTDRSGGRLELLSYRPGG